MLQTTTLAKAIILDICLEYNINPLTFREIETGYPINLHDLCNNMANHLNTNPNHYMALYFNTDEPTIELESAESHQSLLDHYGWTDNPGSLILNYKRINFNGTDYLIDIITDI
jgi:hypothetical protein